MKKLSIVIPAYNEEKTIGEVIRRCKRAFSDMKPEIIVINDASTDHTGYIAAQNGAKVYRNKKNMGHGQSLIEGLKMAKGQSVLYMDADDQISPDSLTRNYFSHDMVTGYRVHRQDPFFRKVISFVLRVVLFIRYRLVIRDANCPFKLIKRPLLRILLAGLPQGSIVPTIDLMILANFIGIPIYEVPVIHQPYVGKRKGFLQSWNQKSLAFFDAAFREVWNL